jgi:hypothetical protein
MTRYDGRWVNQFIAWYYFSAHLAKSAYLLSLAAHSAAPVGGMRCAFPPYGLPFGHAPRNSSDAACSAALGVDPSLVSPTDY